MTSKEFAAQMKQQQKREQAANRRYQKPALSYFGWYNIYERLYEIQNGITEITDLGYRGELASAVDGDEELAEELIFAASEIDYRVQQLLESMNRMEWDMGDAEWEDFGKKFDDCTVNLLGNRYELVGYDSYYEDYMSLLAGVDEEWAVEGAGKRLMTLTKKDLLTTISRCMGLFLSVYDLEMQYRTIEDTVNFIQNESLAIIEQIKRIESLYDDTMEEIEKNKQFYGYHRKGEKEMKFDELANLLPEKVWIE